MSSTKINIDGRSLILPKIIRKIARLNGSKQFRVVVGKIRQLFEEKSIKIAKKCGEKSE